VAVRVLRLIEYTYPDLEIADIDMRHWNLPPSGAKQYKIGCTVRSSIILDPFPDNTEEIKWQITRQTGPSGGPQPKKP
jgi:hypothetical protein